MSKSQVRFMQHIARNSASVSISGLGVDREREAKRGGGGSGKKGGARRATKTPTRGPAAYGIRRLHVLALQELERYVASGRLAHPPSVTHAAMVACSAWFDKVSGAERSRVLVPGLTRKEQADCQWAFKAWLKAAAGFSAKPVRSRALLENRRFEISAEVLPGAMPRLLDGLAVAAWWIRGAIIRAVAETKGEGWMAIPPRPGCAPAVVDASALDAIIEAVERGDGDGVVRHLLQGPAEAEEPAEVHALTKPDVTAVTGSVEQRLVRVEYDRVKTERANAEHSRVVLALIRYLEACGWRAEAEVDWIDVLGAHGGVESIFEVKSITDDNETAQIRAGVAQLLEYRWRTGRPSASLWLVLSRRPVQEWIGGYLKSVGIGLLWFTADGRAGGPELKRPQ
ncbi:hypothetical protein ACJ41P_24545 [Azospirillum argentinense]|uniref:Protein NO VEIN C-terminal domain-containing protein n=1 Tax=Azospirillum argentinense TaxID=2970906 RepID=A0ABW8VIN4_9PROT